MKKIFTRAALYRLRITELSALFAKEAASLLTDDKNAAQNMEEIARVITAKKKSPKPPGL